MIKKNAAGRAPIVPVVFLLILTGCQARSGLTGSEAANLPAPPGSPNNSQSQPQANNSPPSFDPEAPEYLLRTRGYLEAVPLSQAVEEFNVRAQGNRVGSTQPPLTVEEVVACIRDWVPKQEPIDPAMYKVFVDIAETEMMPKGSYFFFSSGRGAYRGYDVDAWHIYLRVGLDKYPDDQVGVPAYSRLIRTQYITSRPSKGIIPSPPE